MRHFKKAEPYIQELRQKKNDNSLFIEFEKVVKGWYPPETIECASQKYSPETLVKPKGKTA